jgi:hypothetical protein
MKIKETRKLYRDDIRHLCVKQNWYTCGDNDDYSSILNYVDCLENVTAWEIGIIATDIKEHSETEYLVESICFEIARICRSHFEIEEVTQ